VWHTNARFPRASFPRDICVPAPSAGENVGEADLGSVQADLSALNEAMMSEPHDRSTCASSFSHACNILSRGFRAIGIGAYYANGVLWLTEDFTS